MADGETCVEVRTARVEDAAELAALVGELGYPTTSDVIARRVEALARSNEAVLVAVRGGRLVAFVTVHVMPVLHRPTAVGRMSALCVTESERGHGVGRLLVAAAERHVLERGCALIEVTSNKNRPDAHAFYQRLGYAITSHRFGKVLAQ